MCYVFAAATEDQNQVSEEVNNAPKVYDQTPFVYTNDKVHITLVGNNDDKNSIKFDIVSNPSHGTLDNFDPSTGTVTYIPKENNEIDVFWHNYIKDHDQIMASESLDEVINSVAQSKLIKTLSV